DFFDYKNYANSDAGYELIRKYDVPDANVHAEPRNARFFSGNTTHSKFFQMKILWRLLRTRWWPLSCDISAVEPPGSKIWSEDDQRYYSVSIKDERINDFLGKIARDQTERTEGHIGTLAEALKDYVGASAVQRKEFFRSVFIGDDWGAPPRLNYAPWILEF